MKIKKQIIVNLIITCLTFMIIFGLGEFIVRKLEPPKSRFEFIMSRPETKRLYEMRPFSSGYLLGKPVVINSFGVRDEEFRIAKQAGHFRIIGLGDSITMAAGVDNEEGYLKKLENSLNSGSGRQRFEVINFGIWGYNTVQEVDFFAAKGLSLSPDLVLVGFFPNDAAKVTQVGAEKTPFLKKFMSNSHFLNLLRPRLAALGRRLNLPIKTYVSSLLEDFLPNSPTWIDSQAALRYLKSLAENYNFRLAVVIIPITVDLNEKYPLRKIHQAVGRFCLDEGIVCWDAFEAFNGLKESSLYISLTDFHLNAAGHAVLASFIAQKLFESSLIPEISGNSHLNNRACSKVT